MSSSKECNNECIKSLIREFIEQSFKKELSKNQYKKKYKDLEIKVSFGQGNKAKITWMAFLGYNQEVQKGIYPVLLFNWDKNILIVSYGVSASNEPKLKWPNINEELKIENFSENNINELFEKYKTSYIENIFYDVNGKNFENISDKLIESLNKVIEIFHGIFRENCFNFYKHKIIPLNLILQGPPGTGKTYNTINKALKIIAEKDDQLKEFLKSNLYERRVK